MKSKILLVTHNFSYTGGPLVLFQLAKGLRDRGYDVWVAGYPSSVAESKNPESVGLYQDYVNAGIPTMMCDCAIPIMDQIKPDLVIGNTLLTHYAVRAATDRGIPTLWWLHEGAWAKQVLWHPLMQEALYKATLVVSSQYLQKLYHTDGWYVPKLIKYGVPETPEPSPLDPRKYSREIGGLGLSIRFMVAGTVEWRKGQDIALAAWKQAKPIGATLTIVGGGWNTPFGQSIAKEASGLTNVSVVYPVLPDQFAHMLAGHDILLVPSRDEGGYAQVMLQAQELGKLVIASSLPGVLEQIAPQEPSFPIGDKKASLLYGMPVENTATAFAQAISSVIQDQTLITVIGRQARPWAHKNNSLVEHLNSWEKLIGEVLK